MTDEEHFVLTMLPSALGMTLVRMCTRCGALIADEPTGEVAENLSGPAQGHRHLHETLDIIARLVGARFHD